MENPPDNMLYNMGFQLKQGELYKSTYKKKEENATPNITIENFGNLNKSKYMLSNTRANVVANEDNHEMSSLSYMYNSAAKDFGTARKSLNQKEEHFIKAESKSNPYLGKNVNIKNVGLAYVTDKGFYKPYTSTKQFDKISSKSSCLLSSNAQGCCPTQIETDEVDLDETALTRGTHMADGQGCGNEGKNLYINQTAVPENLVYNNCYNATDDASAEQTELGTNVTVANCAQRAADSNKNIFSIQKGSIGTDQCFIWDKLPTDDLNTGIKRLMRWNDDEDTPKISGGSPLMVMLKNGMFQIWMVGSSVMKKAQKVRAFKSSDMSSANRTDYLDVGNKYRAAYVDLMNELEDITPSFSVFDFLKTVGGGATVFEDLGVWQKWLTENSEGLDWWSCDTTYGGGVNSVTATWGANCDQESGNYTNILSSQADGRSQLSTTVENLKTWKKKSKPKVTAKWYQVSKLAKQGIALAEWEAECDLGAKAAATAGISIGSHSSKCGSWEYTSPCPDTSKNFTSFYKCGWADGDTFKIGSDGDGAQKGDIVKLDCDKESSLCGSYELMLTDTGSLELVRNSDETKAFSFFKQDNDDWKGEVIANSMWGENTEGYSISQQDVLFGGEFLTDSNNVFQLILQPTGTLDLNMAVKACIKYSENCDADDVCPEYYHPDPALTDPLTSAYYTFDTPNNNNLNKAAYITDDGKLKEYPNNMITKAGNTFTKSPAYMMAGKYTELNSSGLSSSQATSSPDDMASNCIALGDRCVGYTYSDNAGSSNNKYYSKMYPSSDVTRIPTAGTDMYIRNISVKNNLSCNKVVQGGPSNLWDSYDILDNMTHDYKCDLAHNTKNEQKHYNTANKKLNQAVHNVQDKLSSLTDTGLSLTGEMQNQVKKRRKGFEDYEYIRANLGNVQDTITNVAALEEDTDVLLISDNYKYILWSILAIVFVIAGIKLSRK